MTKRHRIHLALAVVGVLVLTACVAGPNNVLGVAVHATS